MTIKLKEKPFNLGDEQIEWVENTFAGMTLDEKVGQLFCPSISMFNKKTVRHYTQDLKIGSLMIRPFPVKGLQAKIRHLQTSSKYPVLISANLENGGSGAVSEGTLFSMPMGCTATNDIETGYRLGKVSCQEAASVGVNWGYAPIVDIDKNFRNPITNIRAFSDDPDKVIEMARAYIKGASEEGVVPTIKHFPGDGCDERDQHLLISVNDLSYEEWMKSYGKVYRTLIDEGAQTVMVGHIAQPEMAIAMEEDISKEESFLPASQSKPLLTGLLRGRLGFNGVVVTDSTLMVGYMQSMPRRQAVPRSIECGADMILFNRNIDEDFNYMKRGIQEGLVSMERVDEAVIRILALKASMNLHIKHQEGSIVPSADPFHIINKPQTKEWTKECADKAVTLVKDNRHILPLDPVKTKRIYLNVIENYVSNNSAFARSIKKRLEAEGFHVTLRKRKMEINQELLLKGIPTPTILKVMKEIMASTDEFVSQYDMCLIVLNMETVSNATTVRVNWKVMSGLGNDIPWYAGEMPLVVVSTANPYHLLDIPMAHAYINAYTGNEETLDAVMDKMLGRSEFKGVSPVDAFCGHEDCTL
ncbi:MAG: glycoside hydrolase family 3 protein [Lachnospiraceae bacterium]